MTRQGPELEARTSSKCAELACLACYIPDRHCSTLCIPIDLSSIYLHLFRGAWAPNRAPNPGPEPKLRTNRATTLNLNLNHVCYISKAYFARLPISWRLGSPSRPRIRAPNPGPESSNIRRLHSTWIWTMLVTSLRHSFARLHVQYTHFIPLEIRPETMRAPFCRVPSLSPYKMVWGHLQNGSAHGGCCLQNGGTRVPHLPTNIKYFGLTYVNIVSKKLWKMGEPFCKTQSNPVVAPWSFLGDQFVDSLPWMKFLLKISQAILAYLTFLHFVHLAIGFHKVSSNRSSQIDWTEVVVIAFFFWTGAGFKILEALILFS